MIASLAWHAADGEICLVGSGKGLATTPHVASSTQGYLTTALRAVTTVLAKWVVENLNQKETCRPWQPYCYLSAYGDRSDYTSPFT